jgi:purine nucleosidase
MLKKHLVIDTDIGTDVDDALALVQALRSNLEHKISITTSYGNVNLRARIASKYCELSSERLEIFPGEKKTLSGREIWMSGLEGSLHSQLNSVRVGEKPAIDHLIELTTKENTAVSILAIAPLTNIATAMLKNSEFENRVEHIYLMGGRFGEGKAEHNILCDIEAAKIVFGSSVRISIVGIEITEELKLYKDFVKSISSCGPAGTMLAKEIPQWWDFWKRDWIAPHDSIALLMLTHPKLFTFSNWGQIEVISNKSNLGKTRFKKTISGRHRIVTKLDYDGAKSAILKSIEDVRFSS